MLTKIYIFVCTLTCANIIFAQQPPRPQRPAVAITSYENTRLRGQRAPVTPTTLLLLGLGGATIGSTIIKNSKKGGE